MANPNRRAGTIFFKVDSRQYSAKGNFTYNLGSPKRDAIAGSDGIHGYMEKPQVAFIEGEVTDEPTLDLKALTLLDGVTVTLELANGKTIILHDSWYAGEGTGETEEANIGVRFESKQEAEEVKS